ncbi:hypothetical protein [Streptomyces sp. NPDC051567]|uniref:hypothetical protein n=1 Tax=Streptomyces sp. NPDC051567 TaxID=3365660 RepID=UPI0037B4B9FD
MLLVLASFALAGYAGLRLLRGNTFGVILWFAGAAVLHDLVLLPLYSVTDRAAQALCRRGGGGGGGGVGVRAATGQGPGAVGTGVNHLRVPAFVAGLLLLVWWPLVLRRVDGYTAATALPEDVFLGRWLLITAVLFAASAALLLVRMWRGSRALRRGARGQEAARSVTK